MRYLLALSLAFLLPGCGQGLGQLAAPRTGVALDALADFPAIAAQIARATIARDANGTRVSRMPDPGKPKPATFLTYKALDNDLGETVPLHMNALERSGSNGGVNVVALTDEAGPNNTLAYYVRQDDDPERVTSPYMPIWPGERDTGSPTTLAQAVAWGFGAYPAKLRWLDVNNHGYGALGIAEDARSKSRMGLPALAAAVAAGAGDRPLDLISFDACKMATAEVAYELRGAAGLMVASEDDSGAVGMNYEKTLAPLEGKPMTGQALARSLVLRAERRGARRALYSLSALDLGRAEALAQAVDQLAGALLHALPTRRAAIREAIAATPRFHLAGAGEDDAAHHRDLAALVASFRGRVADRAVTAACDDVKEALFGKRRLVLLALAAPEQKGAADGVSIYVKAEGPLPKAYRATAFARDTRWDEFLTRLGGE